MSQPGWYPDPAGRPGHFRYWTGSSWASGTTETPSGPPAVGAPPTPEHRRGRLGVLLLLAALAVVLVVVGVLVVRSIVLAPPPSAQPGPLPSTSVSGGDDRSPDVSAPSTSAAPPPATPTPPPSGDDPDSPRPTASASSVPCPEGNPTARSRHPADDRIHGGDISFPELPAQDYRANPMSGFTFAYDMAGQSQIPGRDWFTLMGVGALNVNGFERGPRDATEIVLRCILPTAYVGSPVTKREDVRNRRVTVDGAPGWALRTKAYTADDPYSKGQLIEIIVLDTDAPEAWSFFYGAVRLDDADRIALLDQTVRSLQVD